MLMMLVGVEDIRSFSVLVDGDINKGRSHKYVKREPYFKDGKKRYRYWYRTPSGGLVTSSSLEAGTKFRHGVKEGRGHYEIQNIHKDEDGNVTHVTIKHDELHGEDHPGQKVSIDELREMIHYGEHEKPGQDKGDMDETPGEKTDRLLKDWAQVNKTGTAAQKKKIYDELRAHKKAYPVEKDKVNEGIIAGDPSLQEPKKPPVQEPKKEEKTGIDEKEVGDKHVDVGEHVWGAKKDLAKLLINGASSLDDLSASEAYKVTNKKKVIGKLEPEYHESLGMSFGTYYVKTFLVGKVASNPPDNDKARKDYINGCTLLLKGMDSCKTRQDARNFVEEVRTILEGSMYDMANTFEDLSEAQAYSKKMGGKGATRAIKVDGKKIFAPLIPLDQTVVQPLRDMWDAMGLMPLFTTWKGRDAISKAFERAFKKDKEGWPPKAETGEEEAEEGEEGGKKKTGKEKFSWSQEVTGKPEKKGGPPAVTKGDAKQMLSDFNLNNVQFGNWMTQEDREHHLVACHNAMFDLADILGVSPETLSLNGRLSMALGARGSGHAKAHFEGGEHKIINMTKFVGGGSLAHEWGHFLDNVLAETNIPGEAPGKNAFVSDGHERLELPPELNAAVESIKKAIRAHPTKTIHDYVDELGEKLKEEKAAYNAAPPKSDVREKHRLNYNRTLNKKKQASKISLTAKFYGEAAAKKQYGENALEYPSTYLTHARRMPAYWSRDHELFARAFESYIQDRLEDNDRRNSYLVDGTRKKYNVLTKNGFAEPYPQGEERSHINAQFDALMEVLRKGDYLQKAIAAYMRRQVLLRKSYVQQSRDARVKQAIDSLHRVVCLF